MFLDKADNEKINCHCIRCLKCEENAKDIKYWTHEVEEQKVYNFTTLWQKRDKNYQWYIKLNQDNKLVIRAPKMTKEAIHRYCQQAFALSTSTCSSSSIWCYLTHSLGTSSYKIIGTHTKHCKKFPWKISSKKETAHRSSEFNKEAIALVGKWHIAGRWGKINKWQSFLPLRTTKQNSKITRNARY